MALSDKASYVTACWPLDESSGSRVDSVGSLSVTETGVIGSAAGKFSNAASFDRINLEYLSRASATATQMGDIDWMVRLWAYPTELGGYRQAVGVAGEWAIYCENVLGSGQRWTFLVTHPDGSTTSYVRGSSFGAVTINNWYHVIGWHDSINNVLGVSVNDVSDTISFSAGVYTNSGNFYIGAGKDAYADSNGTHDGLIDDVVLMKNNFLSAAERTEDYNSGTGKAFSTWAGAATKYSVPLERPLRRRNSTLLRI